MIYSVVGRVEEHVGSGEPNESPMTREDDRELTLFHQDHAVIVHEPWRSLRHSGLVKMQLTRIERLSCTDKNQLADVLSQFLCRMVLPRLTLESCIKRCNLREVRSAEIHTCCQQ